MRVARLGLTPLKGMAHRARSDVELTMHGPAHDRVFCLVDSASGDVVRTALHPELMACHAEWDPPTLTVGTPYGSVTGRVAHGGGHDVTGDYWGRPVGLLAVDGPWTALLSRVVGRPVRLCQVVDPGAVVWAGSVSLVTTSSLAELARRTGTDLDGSDSLVAHGVRFRPTVVVDTETAPAFVEDGWIGRRLRIGAAEMVVRGSLPRCVVVEHAPGTSVDDAARGAGYTGASVLAALAPDRTHDGGILFGVHGDVTIPGRVATGDEVLVRLSAQPSTTS